MARKKHTTDWDNCIDDVSAKGKGDPYAICTASLKRTNNVYETREGALIRKALADLGLDDEDEGARGDVAPPAIHMPRANGHSGVPGGLEPSPPEGHTPWEGVSRCPTCGQPVGVYQLQVGMCDCGAGLADSDVPVADGDADVGTIPSVQHKVGAQYQAPPPPGPPLRMDTHSHGSRQGKGVAKAPAKAQATKSFIKSRIAETNSLMRQAGLGDVAMDTHSHGNRQNTGRRSPAQTNAKIATDAANRASNDAEAKGTPLAHVIAAQAHASAANFNTKAGNKGLAHAHDAQVIFHMRMSKELQ